MRFEVAMVQRLKDAAPVRPAAPIEGTVLIIEVRFYEEVADELAAGAIAELEARSEEPHV